MTCQICYNEMVTKDQQATIEDALSICDNDCREKCKNEIKNAINDDSVCLYCTCKKLMENHDVI